MELLDQKGADFLSGTGQKAWRAPASDQSTEISSSNMRVTALEERLVALLAIVVISISVYLSFHDVASTGLTWDEWMDFEIARDYYQNQSFLTNLDDPSQARFSHLVAAASFAVFGVSYLAFKLPFVVIGLLGGVGLWRFLARLVRPVVAIVGAAMYFSCPYVLAASRTGATAGDVLVLVTTLGFVITQYRWIDSNRFWPYGAACGVMCGLAIGSKWTGAVLLGAVGVAWSLHLVRQKRWIFDGPVWTGVLAHQWISVALAILACPTLMLGVPFVKSSLAHSLKFTGMALSQFGEMRAASPWYYIPAILVSKFSSVQLLVLVYELFIIIVLWVRRRKSVGPLPLICLLSLLPIVPLATKGFQNAHYYVATVPTVMIITALALDRWLRSRRDVVRHWALWLSAATMVVQLGTCIYLSPDYLLAGRQFGKFFYSQFAGPAVNHCQGLPFAIREINHLIEEEGGPRSAHILRSCMGVMSHALAYGPVESLTPITPYPATHAKRRHFLIIPGSYDYDNQGVAEEATYSTLKETLTTGCRRAGKGHVDYDLWLCPPR